MRSFVLCAIFAVGYSRWTEQQAQDWYARKGWLAGSNFVPSTAENQLEMFQADTFDPVTIDRELGWLQALGFNSVRVFMHNLLWKTDAAGFFKRLDHVLEIAAKRKIGLVATIFDSCWEGHPRAGKQPEPIPGVHNSRWLQDPGFDIVHNRAEFNKLQPYVHALVSRYAQDPRIHIWDVWNEPDNSGYADDLIAPLLSTVFEWVRAAKPSQPITSGVWKMGAHPSAVETVQLSQSDVISFHNYEPLPALTTLIANLKRHNRPLINTEYMARPHGSNFDPHLGYMKSQGVSVHNWGSVNGRSQTHFPWSCNPQNPCLTEPPVWFHDIFRANGTAYRAAEVGYIRSTIRGGEIVETA